MSLLMANNGMLDESMIPVLSLRRTIAKVNSIATDK